MFFAKTSRVVGLDGQLCVLSVDTQNMCYTLIVSWLGKAVFLD